MFPGLYHAHHNLHLEDLSFWLDLAAQAGSPLLELGCGTGRVLIPLAQAGHSCIGLDHDLEMLEFLRSNINSPLAYPPMLVAGDIGRFSFATHFPLVILPCNTLSTLALAERRACLQCVQNHLQLGGIFAVSMPNPEVLERLPARSEPELEDELIHPRTGNPVQVSSAWRRTKHTFVVTWIYDQLMPDGAVERVSVETAHQRCSAQSYLDDIQEAGLRVLDQYGDFDRSGYSPHAPNLIILATG